MNKKLIIATALATTIIGATCFVKTSTPVSHEPSVEELVSLVSVDASKPPVVFHKLLTGGTVDINISRTQTFKGRINTVQVDTKGVTRVGGNITNGTPGMFAYAIDANRTISGMIMLDSGDVYELEVTPDNPAGTYVKRNINSVVCHEHPGDLEFAGAAGDGDAATTEYVNGVPKLSSKPNAKSCVYLDFDGATVQDPMWNAGKLINAKPPLINQSQMQEIWKIVAERYASFNINITTDVTVYDQAVAGSKMRVIFTSSNEWMKGYGGVAFIGSYGAAGSKVYSPTIPAWVFTKMFGKVKNMGECAAHEIGHTLGLSHDGAPGTPYYTGTTAWAPIMGTAYTSNVVQWSKGDYAGANNKQDDVSIIASNKNVGFVDGAIATKSITTGTINTSVVLRNAQGVSTIALTINRTSNVTINATPGAYSGADVQLQIVRAGSIITTGSIAGSQAALVTKTLEPGTYNVNVVPVGDEKSGYNAYGSIGTVIISGSVTVK